MAGLTMAPCCLSAAAIRLTRSMADETGAPNNESATKLAAMHAISLWKARRGTSGAVHSPRLHLHPAEARGV